MEARKLLTQQPLLSKVVRYAVAFYESLLEPKKFHMTNSLPFRHNQFADNGALLPRQCPLCAANNTKTVLELPVSSFARTNATYQQEIVDSFGFEDNHIFPIVRCQSCNFQYSQYQLADDLLERLYREVINHDMSLSKIFRLEKRRMLTRYWSDILALLISLNGKPSTIKILDLGCGWGDFLVTASGPGIQLFGIEPDRKKADFARQLGIRIFNPEDEAEEETPFDIILSNAVFEHLPNPRNAAQKIFNYLKPNGIGFVTVPNTEPRRVEQMAVRLKSGQSISGEFNPWEHLNYFSHDTLRRLLTNVGLKVIQPPEPIFKVLTRKTYDVIKALSLATWIDRKVPIGPWVYPTRLYVTR